MKPGDIIHLVGNVKSHGEGVTQNLGLTKNTHVTVLVLGITPGAEPTPQQVQDMIIAHRARNP